MRAAGGGPAGPAPGPSQPIVPLRGCQEAWHWAPLPSCPGLDSRHRTGRDWHAALWALFGFCRRMPAGSLLDWEPTSGSPWRLVSEEHKRCVSSALMAVSVFWTRVTLVQTPLFSTCSVGRDVLWCTRIKKTGWGRIFLSRLCLRQISDQGPACLPAELQPVTRLH